MKIGIVTFHCAVNYGALLQAFGLQEYLKGLGHEVWVIDYRPKALTDAYRIFGYRWDRALPAGRNLKLLLRSLVASPIRLKRKIRFRRFIDRHLNLCPMDVATCSSLDAIVTGSDQIWNTEITHGCDRIYFGQVPGAVGKRRIAYAASAGPREVFRRSCPEMLPFIREYDSISVREKFLADELETLLPGKPVQVTIDPVLLVGREPFLQVSTVKKKLRKPYLLVFSLAYDDILGRTRQLAENVAGERNLEVVTVISWNESLRDKSVLDSKNPEDIIALFRDASYVITSSFHGLLFSLLFCRDFNLMIGSNRGTGERMVDLLSRLKLESRIVSEESDRIDMTHIDYVSVNLTLEELRKQSQKFLKDALAGS